jgi:type I site-specific restriction endonuclease
MVPIEMVRELQSRHREEVEHLRADIARHNAQAARQLAERDALHRDTLERLAAQAAIERSVMLERVDAAEIRAERVEQRLDQVLDTLLAVRRSWWARWFGASNRSDIGG